MRSARMKQVPALLVPVAVAWMVFPSGVWLTSGVVVTTVVVASGLAFRLLVKGVRIQRAWLWLVALVAWGLLGALISRVAVIEALPFVGVGAIAALLALAAHDPRGKFWAVLAVVTGGSIGAAWLVVERIVEGGRPAGPFGNPNLAATIAVLAFALIPTVRLTALPRIALALLLLAGMVAGGSRAAMLGALVVGFIWALAATTPRRRLAAALIAGLAVAGLAARVAGDRDPLRFERVRIWVVAVKTMVAELPLGCGASGYADAALPHNFAREGELARYHRLPTLAESDLLQGAATLGLPGILLALGLMGSLISAMGRGDRWAAGVGAAILTTSAFHTQLPLPGVAWTATLALVAVLPRGRGPRVRLGPAVAAALLLALGVPAAATVGWQGWGRSPVEAAVARGARLLRHRGVSDDRLADAQAEVSWACAVRPRHARAWAVLGGLRLERAIKRGEDALAMGAAEAYGSARRANATSVWAVLGEGRSWRLLGDRAKALRALRSAIALEPHCAPAWVELALLHLEAGELAAAREAVRQATEAVALGRRTRLVTGYERDLVRIDPASLERLRERCGGGV